MSTALEQWVEKGKAPSSFVASQVNDQGAIERTRLLCPFPRVAKYRGQRDVKNAENFACSQKWKAGRDSFPQTLVGGNRLPAGPRLASDRTVRSLQCLSIILR